MGGTSQDRGPNDGLRSLDPANLAEWSQGVWSGGCPSSLRGVSIDTRSLKPGDLFFALRGTQHDGHDFVADAFRKGAGGAVVARDRAPAKDGRYPCLLVSEPGAALRAMAAGYRRRLDPRVIGVTGSAGKSTVKEMTAGMLAKRYRTGRTLGNWNNDVGLPLSCLSMGADVEVAVFELGTNHPGEIAALCALARPDCGIVTNVGPAHIEFFGSLRGIAEEKSVLFRNLPLHGLAVLNKDDDSFDYLAGAAPCERRTISLRAEADYRCLRWDPVTREALVADGPAGERAVLRMPLPGDFNVANALLAAAAARWMGVSWSDIREALAGYRGMPMRWQEGEAHGRRFITDSYNANPMNMRASIRVFRDEIAASGKWLLLGGMLELGERSDGEHVALGRWVGEHDWSGLIVVGGLAGRIADGAQESGFSGERIVRCADREEALAAVRDRTGPGSAVLVKGSRRFELEKVVAAYEGEAGRPHGTTKSDEV